MKKRITYGILIIILISGIYLVSRFVFGFFTPFNFLTAKQDIRNNKIQIVIIGEIPLSFEQKQKLANSNGFYYNLFGCNATTDILNGVEYYNEVMIKHLEQKYGNDWWVNFENKLDSIDNMTLKTSTVEKVLDLVAKQKNVKSKINLIDSLSKSQRHISLIPILKDTTNNIYLVKVGEDNGLNFVIYFNFLVDANTMTIINNKGEIENNE